MRPLIKSLIKLSSILLLPALANAGDVPPPNDLTPQICKNLGSGMVRCSGERLMDIPQKGIELQLRSLEIRTEPLAKDPEINVKIINEGEEFVAIRASNQPVNNGNETQIVIEAQSFKAGGSTDKVMCRYAITGKRR